MTEAELCCEWTTGRVLKTGAAILSSPMLAQGWGSRTSLCNTGVLTKF